MNTTASKPWWKSQTIISQALDMIFKVLIMLGIGFTPELAEAFLTVFNEVWAFVLGGIALANNVWGIIGRIKAAIKIG